MRKIELNGKEGRYIHNVYLHKSQKEKLEVIMEEEGIDDYSKAIRKCIDGFYEERYVRCAFCNREIKVKNAFKVGRNYFCNNECFKNFVRTPESVSVLAL